MHIGVNSGFRSGSTPAPHTAPALPCPALTCAASIAAMLCCAALSQAARRSGFPALCCAASSYAIWPAGSSSALQPACCSTAAPQTRAASSTLFPDTGLPLVLCRYLPKCAVLPQRLCSPCLQCAVCPRCDCGIWHAGSCSAPGRAVLPCPARPCCSTCSHTIQAVILF